MVDDMNTQEDIDKMMAKLEAAQNAKSIDEYDREIKALKALAVRLFKGEQTTGDIVTLFDLRDE